MVLLFYRIPHHLYCKKQYKYITMDKVMEAIKLKLKLKFLGFGARRCVAHLLAPIHPCMFNNRIKLLSNISLG